MNIIVNSEQIETNSSNIQELIKELGLPEKGIAIGCNNKIVPRASFSTTNLIEGMSLVIIKAAAGG